MKAIFLRRGKIGWMVKPYSITAFDNLQATVYNIYGAPNEQCLSRMRWLVLNSKEDEYSDWVKVIALARECHLRGFGTDLPEIES